MLKDRITERLGVLDISVHEAAERMKRHRNYVYDFMNGRKTEFKGRGPKQLAEVLGTTVEYLNGQTDDPTPSSTPAPSHIGPAVVGVLELGAWRTNTPLSSKHPLTVPVPLDPRYPANAQTAYVVRGDGMADLGIDEDVVVVCIDYNKCSDSNGLAEPDAIMIVERRRQAGAITMIETTARRVSREGEDLRLSARSGQGVEDSFLVNSKTMQEADGTSVKFVAVVGISFRVY